MDFLGPTCLPCATGRRSAWHVSGDVILGAPNCHDLPSEGSWQWLGWRYVVCQPQVQEFQGLKKMEGFLNLEVSPWNLKQQKDLGFYTKLGGIPYITKTFRYLKWKNRILFSAILGEWETFRILRQLV